MSLQVENLTKTYVGRRLTFPWHTAEGLSGAVRMDFAFDEALHSTPSWVAIPNPVGDSAPVMAAVADATYRRAFANVSASEYVGPCYLTSPPRTNDGCEK